MLTLILLATLAVPPQAPCLPQTVLPVVDDLPKPPSVKTCHCSERCVCGCNAGEPCACAGPRLSGAQPTYRIGSLPQGFTQPAAPVYYSVPQGYCPTGVCTILGR